MKFNRPFIFCLLQFCVAFIATSTLAQNRLEWFVKTENLGIGNCYITNFTVLKDESVMVFGSMYLDSSRFCMENDTVGFSFCAFIAKFEKNGRLVFIKPFNKDTSEHIYSQLELISYTTTDNSGNSYIVGQFNGNWKFNSNTLTSTLYNNNEILVKIDSNGEVVNYKVLSNNRFAKAIFLGRNNKLYLSRYDYSAPYERFLETIDTGLVSSTSHLLGSSYQYLITDMDSSGHFLATGVAIVNSEIDPGPNDFWTGSHNSFIAILDSSLNLIQYKGFDDIASYNKSCFNSKGEIYFMLCGVISGNVAGLLHLDSNNPYGIIPVSSSSISLFDRSLNLKWVRYGVIDRSIDSDMIMSPTMNYILKNQLRKDDGIIIQAIGFTSPGNCNFSNPSMETIPAPLADLPTHLVLFDSLGNVTNSINTNSNYKYHDFKILPDNSVYVLQRLFHPCDISINSIPKILTSIADLSFFLKYKLTNTECHVAGKLIGDLNSNTFIDPSDVPIPFHPAYLDSTQFVALSNDKGEFQIFCDTGNYVLKTNNIPNFNSALPHSINVQLDSLTPYSLNHKFFFTPENNILDLSTISLAIPRVRPGQQTKTSIVIENKGTISSTFRLFLKYNGSIVNLINSSLTPLTINNDSICWNISTLKPFEKKIIYVNFYVSQNAGISDTAYYFAEVWPTGNNLNEYTVSNNYDTAFSVISTSFDPNDKVSSKPANIPITSLDSSLYFTYTINFQNTGNDTAFKVVIVDTLPKNGDLGTFEWIGSSHEGKPELVDGHILVVTFTNILLPDSNIDELNSHGFIAYRIRPFLNLLPGDQMKNSADIFFDYNKPVKTNTTVSTFVIPQSINEINSGTFKPFVYPNPSHSTVRIIAPLNKKIIHIEFSDLQGRIITSNAVKMNQNIEVDVSDFSDGVYFLTVYYDDKLQATVKVLVQ